MNIRIRKIQSSLLTIFFVLGLANGLSAKEYNGVLDWSMRTELAVPVNGVIKTVPAQVGDKVNKGQVLLSLDKSVFNAYFADAKAMLVSQTAIYKESQRELERATELYDRTVLSDHDLQIAKNKSLRAKANLAKTKANYIQREYNLRYSTLNAPFNLFVLARYAQVGEVVVSDVEAKILFVVVASDYMLARIFVSSSDVGLFNKGDKASVTLNGKTYEGVVSLIGLEADTQHKGQYPLEVKFKTSGDLIRAGQSVTVDIN